MVPLAEQMSLLTDTVQPCVREDVHRDANMRTNFYHSTGRCEACDVDTHYNNAIMSAMVSQITSLTTVCWTVYSRADKKNINAPRQRPLWGEFTGNRRIPRTKCQKCGTYYYLMTSSCYHCLSFCNHSKLLYTQPIVTFGNDIYGSLCRI